MTLASSPANSLSANDGSVYLTGDGRYRNRYEEDHSGQDFQRFLFMLFRRRKSIIATFLTVLIVGAVITKITRPIYQAGATILVNTSTRSSNEDVPGVGVLLDNSQTRKLETQIEIMKSGTVQKGARERLTGADRAALSEYVSLVFKPVRNTDVVSITAQTYSASSAQSLVNAICAEYIQLSQQQNNEQVQAATRYVQEQRKSVLERLNRARTQLKNFKETNNMVDLPSETQLTVGRVGSLETELGSAEMDAAAGEARLKELRAAVAKMAPEITQRTVVQSPVVKALKDQLTKLELDRLAALQKKTPTSREVRGIDGQIASIRERLKKEATTEAGDLQKSVNPAWQETMQDITKTQSDIWAAQARAVALRSASSEARQKMSKLPELDYKLGQINSDVQALQQTYQMLNERFQTLLIQSNAPVANAKLLSPASFSPVPISPKKMQNLIMFGWLGLILSIGLAVLLERLDNRVHSDEDAETASHMAVLAHVPYIKEPDQQSLLKHLDHPSPLLESYRMLSANLVFAAIDEPLRTVAITSSRPNEGKSVSSINLAIVSALRGQKVILVDCDLRRPTLHRRLQLSNRIGFTNVVTGEVSLEEALQETVIPGLRVLTSGPQPPNPPELLHSQAGRECIRKLKQAADFVVIDSPPALAMADAQFVSSMVDGVLMVISAQEAGRREITRTRNLLAQTGTKLLGVVLNKVTSDFGNYYDYKYRYYNSYFNADNQPARDEMVDDDEFKKLPSQNGKNPS